MDEPQDEDQQPFIPTAEKYDFSRKAKPQAALGRHLRLFVEIGMACIIVLLLVHASLSENKPEPSAVPKFPRKTYVFAENTRYLHEDMFVSEEETLHTLHNWIELSADGRGYVQVGDADNFDLGEPYEIQMNATHSEPVYMMSVFHQLHCLSYLVQHFQRGFDGAELNQEVAHHSAHCFDNIRQAIMCGADTSLEGKTDTPGWGAKHDCTDYDALLSWANEHTVYKWRKNMPLEAVL